MPPTRTRRGAQTREMCEQLLANPVTEDFEIAEVHALMKFGIVTFPGSNCDYDAFQAVVETLGEEAVQLWHKDHDLQGSDVVILPGGFSYGDYLRAGAIARFSPDHAGGRRSTRIAAAPCSASATASRSPARRASCPARCCATRRSSSCASRSTLRVENDRHAVHQRATSAASRSRCPIAHGDGRYTADDETLDRLEGEGRVVFRYVDASALEATEAYNPNGSMRDIAGIVNERGNVLGMMPHPERAVDAAARLGRRTARCSNRSSHASPSDEERLMRLLITLDTARTRRRRRGAGYRTISPANVPRQGRRGARRADDRANASPSSATCSTRTRAARSAE